MGLPTCGLSSGSSPRIRGTPLVAFGTSTYSGLIPAHTGNARAPSVAGLERRAHPRAYGERWLSLPWSSEAWGSSPRIRGTQVVSHAECQKAGLIPAHTGNARRRVALIRGLRAHPRAYGEREACNHLKALDRGSSPRIRGTLACVLTAGVLCRLIPAHTGNALSHKA